MNSYQFQRQAGRIPPASSVSNSYARMVGEKSGDYARRVNRQGDVNQSNALLNQIRSRYNRDRERFEMLKNEGEVPIDEEFMSFDDYFNKWKGGLMLNPGEMR